MKDLDTKDTYTRIFLNSIKKKLSYCPVTSHECAAKLIRKRVKKFWKNIHIRIWQNLGLMSHMPSRSLNIHKFEGSKWKFDFRNDINAKVTWSPFMRIFNEISRSYSIPSKILIQMAYIAYIIKIHCKQLKLSSGHLKSTENNSSYRTDTKHSRPSTQVYCEKRKQIGLNTDISCVPIRPL